MKGLVAAGNTYNPSLLVLRSQGYDLRVEQGEDGQTIYVARKNGLEFLGYSAPELLGLVTLWQCMGENWNRQAPNLLGELLDSRAPSKSTARRKKVQLNRGNGHAHSRHHPPRRHAAAGQ